MIEKRTIVERSGPLGADRLSDARQHLPSLYPSVVTSGALLVVALMGVLLALCPIDGWGTSAVGATTADSGNPAEVITSVARALLSAIDARRDEYRADPAKLDTLVRGLVLPHFDSNLAARLVLARRWTDASVAQRRRFVNAFYHLLLHNFGADLADFSLDRLQVLPYRGDATASYATVETLVHRRNGDLLHINYSLHRTPQGWKVFDIAFEGISYLTGFRSDFSEEIEQKGLDELISRLEKVYDDGTVAKTS